ncbi:hypothetical protein LC55x_0137 [Lysobacter capsici]|nr:hypothetical protein LC55x_0137 [Lysobacter capsici]
MIRRTSSGVRWQARSDRARFDFEENGHDGGFEGNAAGARRVR